MFLKKNRQTEDWKREKQKSKKKKLHSLITQQNTKRNFFIIKSTLPGTSRVTYQHRTKEEEGEEKSRSSSSSRAVE